MESVQTRSPFTASAIIIQNKFKDFDCDSNVIAGNVVYLSDTIANKVIKFTNNRSAFLPIGVAISKYSSTRVKVQLYGECMLTFPTLDEGKPVYLSASAIPSSTIPTTGYIQILGYSLTNTNIYINISEMRIKRNPF